MRFDHRAHHEAVNAFFERCRAEDPERFREVCEKYPCLTRKMFRRIRRSERTVGLLGLQPASIPQGVAEEYGYESIYEEEE